MEKLKSYIQKRAKRTQSEWAAAFGISPATLSGLLSGKRSPSVQMMRRIEEATGGKVPAAAWLK